VKRDPRDTTNRGATVLLDRLDKYQVAFDDTGGYRGYWASETHPAYRKLRIFCVLAGIPMATIGLWLRLRPGTLSINLDNDLKDIKTEHIIDDMLELPHRKEEI
jgi:hypothetical protein